MNPILINGKEVAQQVRAGLISQIQELKDRGVTPGLAVILVGKDPASQVYVGSKVKACAELGLKSFHYELPEETTQDELIALIHRLNADPEVHGILVQSPPPRHIDESAVILNIDPRKDVDGFHPVNVAKLVLEEGRMCRPAALHGAAQVCRRGDSGQACRRHRPQHDCRQTHGTPPAR